MTRTLLTCLVVNINTIFFTLTCAIQNLMIAVKRLTCFLINRLLESYGSLSAELHETYNNLYKI